MKREYIRYFFSKSDCVELVYSRNVKLSFAEHNHASSYIIGIIMDGIVLLNRNNEVKPYKKDNYYIIAPYEPHSVSSDGNECTMISVSINKAFVRECNKDYIIQLILELIINISFERIEKNSLINIVKNSVNELFTDTTYGNKSNQSLNTAIDILECRYCEKIDIEELSKSVFISKYHFIRQFKKYAGLTPHNFQVQRKIRQSQRMLRNNSNITEIALAAGFCDQSHFIKCFKKIVGITPSEYIAAQRKT